MKQTGIFIDLRNGKQVKWWNSIASKLVKVVSYTYIDETATGKHVGVLMNITGPLKNLVIRHNTKKFINNPVTHVFDV